MTESMFPDEFPTKEKKRRRRRTLLEKRLLVVDAMNLDVDMHEVMVVATTLTSRHAVPFSAKTLIGFTGCTEAEARWVLDTINEGHRWARTTGQDKDYDDPLEWPQYLPELKTV